MFSFLFDATFTEARLRGELDDAQRQQKIEQALFFVLSIQQGKVLSQRLLNRAGEACSGTARRVETTRSRGGVFCS